MPKKNKREKQTPYFIVFLVEGESDQTALEIPLAQMIIENNPEYEVRFLLQQKLINKLGEEVEDENDVEDEDNEYILEDEYECGGDITTSSYVTPANIERKINHRFIKPATKSEGIYPKLISKIIQIIDLDGAYIQDECIVHPSLEHKDWIGPFYNGEKGVIETNEIESIIDRNERKRNNIDYLLSLHNKGIKIGNKTIPFEIYYFSSNLDHFINHDANMQKSKKYMADRFMRKYGLDLDEFCEFFYRDPASIGYLGYEESWEKIKIDNNSVRRFTNIDYLIRYLKK